MLMPQCAHAQETYLKLDLFENSGITPYLLNHLQLKHQRRDYAQLLWLVMTRRITTSEHQRPTVKYYNQKTCDAMLTL